MSEPRGRWGDRNSSRFHRCGLGTGVTLAAGDNRAGVTHAAPGRCGYPGDKTDRRLLAAALGFVLEELGGIFLGRTADLADHHDRGGLGVRQEHFKYSDELGALDRIAADADRCGLAEALLGCLEHGLIAVSSTH